MAEFEDLLEEDVSASLGKPPGVQQVPLADIEDVVPSQEESEAASAGAASVSRPRDPTQLPFVAQPGGRIDDFTVALAEDLGRPSPDLPDRDPSEVRRMLINLGVMAGASAIPGSLPVRIGAQALAGFGSDTALSLAEGREPAEALKQGVVTGGIAGGAEALAPPALKAGGIIFGLVRRGAHAARAGIRQVRGVLPMPTRPTISSASRPFGEFIEEGGESAVRTSLDEGVLVTPGQVVEHNLIDIAENVAEAAIGPAGQRLRAVRQGAATVFSQRIDEIVESLPSFSRRDVAETLSGLITGRLKRVKGVAQGHYRAVDAAMGTTKSVNARVAKKVFKDELEIIDDPEIRRAARPLLSKGDDITYAEAARLRSFLLEKSEQFNPERNPVLTASKAAALRAAKALTRAIDDAARQAPPGTRQSLATARRLWSEEVRGVLTDKVVTKMAKEHSEEVLDAILLTGKPSKIRMIRDIVTRENPEAWRNVQGALLRRLQFRSGEERVLEDGSRVVVLSGKKLLNNLRNFGKEDDAAIRAMFPGSDMRIVDNLRKFANALSFAQKKAGGPTGGSVWFNLMQAGALTAVGGGGVAMVFGNERGREIGAGAVLTALPFLIAPNVFAKMLTNPEMVRWLTIGAGSSPGTRAATKATLATLGLMLRNDYFSEPDDRVRASEIVTELKSEE